MPTHYSQQQHHSLHSSTDRRKHLNLLLFDQLDEVTRLYAGTGRWPTYTLAPLHAATVRTRTAPSVSTMLTLLHASPGTCLGTCLGGHACLRSLQLGWRWQGGGEGMWCYPRSHAAGQPISAGTMSSCASSRKAAVSHSLNCRDDHLCRATRLGHENVSQECSWRR